MPNRTIGLIAAMPEELTPLIRLIGPCRRERAGSFQIYHCMIGTHETFLIQSGMGPRNAAAATRALIADARPDLIISFGFAGAVTGGPSVGDIVVAGRLLHHHNRLFSEQQGVDRGQAAHLAASLAETCRENGFRTYAGTFVTSGQILSKHTLARQLPAGVEHPVVEMETAAVAQVAVLAGIPLIAVRSISDGAEDELGFTIDEFTDKDMNIRLWRVLRCIARKPWLVPQLLRLARNTKAAGNNLAAAVAALLKDL